MNEFKSIFKNHISMVSKTTNPMDMVLCCEVKKSISSGIADKHLYLTKGFTEDEYYQFLVNIDETSIKCISTIWFKDGSWSEWDMFEWEWVNHKIPNIPKYLNRIDKIRNEKLNSIGI